MELKNKRIAFLGDSITEGHGTTGESKIFHQLIKEKYNLDMACGCGIGGTRIAKVKTPSYNIIRHDLYFGLRAQVMPKDMDMVVVFGGTNDFGHGDAEIGTFDSRDPYTYYGGIHNLIDILVKKYGKEKITFILPLRKRVVNRGRQKDFAQRNLLAGVAIQGLLWYYIAI